VEAVPATQRAGAADDRQSNERIAQPAVQAQMGPAAAAQGKRSGAGKVGDSLEQTGAEEGADRTKEDDQAAASALPHQPSREEKLAGLRELAAGATAAERRDLRAAAPQCDRQDGGVMRALSDPHAHRPWPGERACSHCQEVKSQMEFHQFMWDKPKDERSLCSTCEDWLTCSMCAKTKWFKQFSRTQRQKWGKDPKKGGRKCNCCITKLYGKKRDVGVQKLKVRSLVALMRRYFVKVAVAELVRVLRLRANISMHLGSIAGISGISLRLRCWKASCEQAAAEAEASAADAEFKPAGFDEAAAEQRQRKNAQKKEKNRRKAARKKARGLVEGEEVQLVRSGGGCGGIAAMQLNHMQEVVERQLAPALVFVIETWTGEQRDKVKVAAFSNGSGWMRAIGQEVTAVGIWAVEASNLALAASPGQVGELWNVQATSEEHFQRDVQVMQWPGELPEVENIQTGASISVEPFLGLVDAGRAVTVLEVKKLNDGCVMLKIDDAVEMDHDHAEDYVPSKYLFDANREPEYFDDRGEDASLYEIPSGLSSLSGTGCVVIMELKNGCRVEHVLRRSVWVAVDSFRPKAVIDAAANLADGSDYGYGEGCSCCSEQDSTDHSDSSD